MRGALDRMAIAIEQGIVGMNADIEFHFAVARASGNEFFEAVMESMRTPLEFAVNLARALALKRPMDHLLTVQAEHVAMFEAIEAQDKDAARLAMRTHIENACSRVFEGPGGGARLARRDRKCSAHRSIAHERAAGPRTGGRILADAMVRNGVERAFCVPGESYLALLDALYDSPIKVTMARQEGGAAMMAEAWGKLTGRPGHRHGDARPGRDQRLGRAACRRDRIRRR